VYGRYNNGPRTLPWGTPGLTGESFVLSFNLYKEVFAVQVGFEYEEMVQREKTS
jgi:hypothetical protein